MIYEASSIMWVSFSGNRMMVALPVVRRFVSLGGDRSKSRWFPFVSLDRLNYPCKLSAHVRE